MGVSEVERGSMRELARILMNWALVVHGSKDLMNYGLSL